LFIPFQTQIVLRATYKQFFTSKAKKKKIYMLNFKVSYLIYPFELRNWVQILLTIIDAHGLKIQGRGYLMFFLPKSLWGVKAFRKNCLWGSRISGFIAFLLTSVLNIVWRGYYIYPPPSPTSPPLCASMLTIDKSFFFTFYRQIKLEKKLDIERFWKALIFFVKFLCRWATGLRCQHLTNLPLINNLKARSNTFLLSTKKYF
jgi:hypothetical protein